MNTHFLGILQALDNITEGVEDYQEEYRKYIYEHKKRVKQFADWMKENLPEVFTDIDDFILNVGGAMAAWAIFNITKVKTHINKLLFGEKE